MQEIAAVKNLHGILYYHFHNTGHTNMMHYKVMLSEYYHTLQVTQREYTQVGTTSVKPYL